MLSSIQVCQMHWFDLLNNCDALYAAFPVGVNECSDTFFGRDLPAFRPSDSTVTDSRVRHFQSRVRPFRNCSDDSKSWRGMPRALFTVNVCHDAAPSNVASWSPDIVHALDPSENSVEYRELNEFYIAGSGEPTPKSTCSILWRQTYSHEENLWLWKEERWSKEGKYISHCIQCSAFQVNSNQR